MALTGTNPPQICKVQLIKPPDEMVADDCTTVSHNTLYVVLSSNGSGATSATVKWAGGELPVSAESGNNLILSGNASDLDVPGTVDVQFPEHDYPNESVNEGTCVPTGCD